MFGSKAIRQGAEWNRTGPVHYQASRLRLSFDLWFSCSGLTENNRNKMLRFLLWHFDFLHSLPLQQASCHILGRWRIIGGTFVFISFPLVWEVAAVDTDTNSDCHHKHKQECRCNVASVCPIQITARAPSSWLSMDRIWPVGEGFCFFPIFCSSWEKHF